ncbi:hypothetical protein BCY88_27780 [Paraburkholderia fungorum]|uniref:Uncharacterized protein n=1 Tax=Paraburkholderia fungorum TaxID=134537 RepID=A0A3R7IM07_9BURK|nr:hypothetical protein BCY88_27780 [Paraburkholderia fungorum]
MPVEHARQTQDIGNTEVVVNKRATGAIAADLANGLDSAQAFPQQGLEGVDQQGPVAGAEFVMVLYGA